MIGDTLEYPFRGSWVRRTAIGGLLILGLPLGVPLLVLVGYAVTVLERTIAGETTPPRFGEWQRLLRRGVGGLAILAAYLSGPLVGAVLGGALLAGAGTVVLSEFAAVLSRDETVIWLVSGLAALVTALLALVAVSMTLLCWYLVPAALARYAHTGRLRAAFERRHLWRTATTSEYLLAVVFVQLVPLAVPVIAVVLALSLVGILLVPPLPYLAVVCCARLVGLGVRDRNDAANPDGQPVSRIEPS